MKEFRWGIVGPGRFAGERIVPAIAAAPGHRLHAVAGRRPDATAEFALTHGIPRACADAAELIADPDVDCVYIASPNALHAGHVEAAARAGKHVLCDKPLATTVGDAERAIAACGSYGVVLAINFQLRQFEDVRWLREAIAGGAIGEVEQIRIAYEVGHHPLARWRTDASLAGQGALFNLGVHAFDMLRYVTGDEVAAIEAVSRLDPDCGLDVANIAVGKLKGGALAVVSCDQYLHHPLHETVIHGSQGRITARDVGRLGRRGASAITLVGADGSVTERRFETSEGAETRVIEDFGEAVRLGGSPAATGEDGLASLKIALAVAPRPS